MNEIIGAICTSLFVGACAIWSCILCEWLSNKKDIFREKIKKEGFVNENEIQ